MISIRISIGSGAGRRPACDAGNGHGVQAELKAVVAGAVVGGSDGLAAGAVWSMKPGSDMKNTAIYETCSLERTDFRSSGSVPSSIHCLISRMMSRYLRRLWSVASVEKLISPARNRWRR